MFSDIKDKLNTTTFRHILAASVHDNSFELAEKKAAEYHNQQNWKMHGWVENGEILGICGFRILQNDRIEILNFAVSSNARKRGIGTAMITALKNDHSLPIHAETGDSTVDFLRKAGFHTTDQGKVGTKKWACVLE